MMELRRTGIIKCIMERIWRTEYKEILLESPPSITLEMVTRIYVLFASGTLVSVVILFIECFTWKRSRRKHRGAPLPLCKCADTIRFNRRKWL